MFCWHSKWFSGNISCEGCNFRKEYCNSVIIHTASNEQPEQSVDLKPKSPYFEINNRFLYTLRYIGKGPSGGSIIMRSSWLAETCLNLTIILDSY